MLPYSQCHGSGFDPPGCAHAGWTQPYWAAFAVSQANAGPAPLFTAQQPPMSTAFAQPWLLVPGTAHSAPFSARHATCSAYGRYPSVIPMSCPNTARKAVFNRSNAAAAEHSNSNAGRLGTGQSAAAGI